MTDRKKSIESTYKSKDTEEWLDIWFTRPIGYVLALFFDALGIHPNVVTIISIILGMFAGFCWWHTTMDWTVLGIIMLMLANFLDSADGQLARMTGLYDEPIPFAGGATWGIWVFVLFFGTGFIFHARQAGLSDYYRNIYLLFHGDHSELNDSRELASQQASTPWKKRWFWKIWLFFYQNYTRGQERMTPCFQNFYADVRGKYGNQVPLELGQEFCSRTYRLLKWTNILTFNTRAITLYIILIIGEPWLYPIFELTVMNVIWLYMRAAHEKVCREMTDLI